MRKLLSCIGLGLALMLAAAGVYCAVRPDAPSSTAGSSTELGLMLLEREDGLFVLAVTRDSPADRADICPGDYLLQVAGKPVATPDQLDALINPSWESVHVLLLREGREVQTRLPTR